MIVIQPTTTYPSAATLVENQAASRVAAKDASLYDYSEEAFIGAQDYMGWTNLASMAPVAPKKIKKLATSFKNQGFKAAILIGQGGSTQASMVLTKYFKAAAPDMAFYILDSDSPVRLRKVLEACDFAHTLIIVSSKSGGTLEMRLMLSAVTDAFCATMKKKSFRKHLVAITDPGSPLEKRAKKEGWAAVLSGEPTVGGRFSALSVFGLFPAALVGIPLKSFMKAAKATEELCGTDSYKNPAIALAAFLYDNYRSGRQELAFVSPKRGRSLGLWIEQLVAESTGKQGKGIQPYLEVQPLHLAQGANDRMVVVYNFPEDSADANGDFAAATSYISTAIPRMDFTIDSVEDLAAHFVMWEYATALCGYLMKVCPFDQPDVAVAKACVIDLLEKGLPAPDLIDRFAGDVNMGLVAMYTSECCKNATSVYDALKDLLGSIGPGDYFAVDAFLPFEGESRKRALEDIRSAVAGTLGVPACLEIGPRYLHSTGQLQKGGPSNGVYLVLSAEEPKDIPLQNQEAVTLGALAQIQAAGDALTLASRGRRVLSLHLPDNYGITLELLSALICEVLSDLQNEGPKH